MLRKILKFMGCPTSNIQHPTSNIQHPTSKKWRIRPADLMMEAFEARRLLSVTGVSVSLVAGDHVEGTPVTLALNFTCTPGDSVSSYTIEWAGSYGTWSSSADDAILTATINDAGTGAASSSVSDGNGHTWYSINSVDSGTGQDYTEYPTHVRAYNHDASEIFDNMGGTPATLRIYDVDPTILMTADEKAWYSEPFHVNVEVSDPGIGYGPDTPSNYMLNWNGITETVSPSTLISLATSHTYFDEIPSGIANLSLTLVRSDNGQEAPVSISKPADWPYVMTFGDTQGFNNTHTFNETLYYKGSPVEGEWVHIQQPIGDRTRIQLDGSWEDEDSLYKELYPTSTSGINNVAFTLTDLQANHPQSTATSLIFSRTGMKTITKTFTLNDPLGT